MLQASPYRNFINGRYFSEGIRMATGIALPAFIAGYFGYLSVGIVLSTGALCVSVTDNAGPLHHRANGMFFCILLTAVTSVVTYLGLYSVAATAIVITLFGFLFSMLSVYNARVSAIGIAALLVMILCMQEPLKGVNIFIHSLYLVIGGCWYMAFSLLLHTIRPYRLIQQLTGEFVTGVADYLQTRASFYEGHPDYESTYKSLLQQQVQIQAAQATLSEMLFTTRAVTRNSTRVGRALLKIYLDVSDLFESIMSVYQQYEVLHQKFDDTGILDEMRKQLLQLSGELREIGNAVAAGNVSAEVQASADGLDTLNTKFAALRATGMNSSNVDDFVGLGRILNNIRNLTEKIRGLHYYTFYEKKQTGNINVEVDTDRLSEKQNIDPALFLNNLNFRSNIFRHSIRVAFSLLAGYLISLFFSIGHNYWILLTIVVILKPAYSLTKKRNTDRLFGTVLGVILGVGILFLTKNNLLLMIIMFIFMAAAYMFIRTKYFISVLLMTIYLVIFFHLIYPGSITAVLKDRIIDTAIASGIAFISSLFFIPVWEHTYISKYMAEMLTQASAYYQCLAANFSGDGNINKDELKKKRQNMLTALANVSDAFNRMLSEPKRFQKKSRDIYRFVVLNHILSSHFSALAFYIDEKKMMFRSDKFLSISKKTTEHFSEAIKLLNDEETASQLQTHDTDELYSESDALLKQRRAEVAAGMLETDTKKKLISAKSITDQFRFIYNLSGDILKNVQGFKEGVES